MQYRRCLLVAILAVTYGSLTEFSYADSCRPDPGIRVRTRPLGAACEDPLVEAFRIPAIDCNWSTLKANLRLDNTTWSSSCEAVTKDGETVAYSCFCNIPEEISCSREDELVNDNRSKLCGKPDHRPPGSSICKENFSVPGPHRWGPFHIPSTDPTYKKIKDALSAGEPLVSQACNWMANNALEETLAEARNKCRFSPNYPSSPPTRITDIPCCTAKVDDDEVSDEQEVVLEEVPAITELCESPTPTPDSDASYCITASPTPFESPTPIITPVYAPTPEDSPVEPAMSDFLYNYSTAP